MDTLISLTKDETLTVCRVRLNPCRHGVASVSGVSNLWVHVDSWNSPVSTSHAGCGIWRSTIWSTFINKCDVSTYCCWVSIETAVKCSGWLIFKVIISDWRWERRNAIWTCWVRSFSDLRSIRETVTITIWISWISSGSNFCSVVNSIVIWVRIIWVSSCSNFSSIIEAVIITVRIKWWSSTFKLGYVSESVTVIVTCCCTYNLNSMESWVWISTDKIHSLCISGQSWVNSIVGLWISISLVSCLSVLSREVSTLLWESVEWVSCTTFEGNLTGSIISITTEVNVKVITISKSTIDSTDLDLSSSVTTDCIDVTIHELVISVGTTVVGVPSSIRTPVNSESIGDWTICTTCSVSATVSAYPTSWWNNSGNSVCIHCSNCIVSVTIEADTFRTRSCS